MSLTLNQAVKEVMVVGVIAVCMYFYVDWVTEKNVDSVSSENVVSVDADAIQYAEAERKLKPVAPVAQTTAQAVVEDKPKVKKTAVNSFPDFGNYAFTVKGMEKKIRMNSDRNCLAVNSYFENRSRSDASLEHTMWTVRNRVGRYHNESVCDSVINALYDPKTGKPIKDSAHYSWVADGKQDMVIGKTPPDMARWEQALRIAERVATAPKSADPTKGATHYHTSDSKAWWAPHMKYLYEFDGNKYYYGW